MLEELRYFTLPKILLGLTLTLAIILGLAVGGFQPLANVLHLRTTIPYYVTLTRTATLIVTNTTILTTTIVVNHTVTLTTTSPIVVTSIYTTTVTNTTTVRTVVIQPVTTTVTVNYTTTVVSTVTLTPPPPGTGGSIVPGVNITKAEYDPAYFIEAFTNYTSLLAPYFSILGLKPVVQFACYATGFRLANGSSGFIVVLVGNTTGVVVVWGYWQFPHGLEGGSYTWAELGVNTTSPMQASVYATTNVLFGYTVGNVTIAGGVLGGGFRGGHPQFPYNMPNGTYLAWLINWNESGIIYPCILEVINTWNWSELANYTYLGAQYWAYEVTQPHFGKPIPCYAPWYWTIGFELARLNITEPIGSNWQYYCGPNGIWRSLKP